MHLFFFRFKLLAAACLVMAAGLPLSARAQSSVYLEELSSPELQAQLDQGLDTVLVPLGGTEQNGPYMVLGKHNVRVHLLAGQIAQRAGHTVVAPVVAYVPEGSIQPPAGHMRFSGTISIPESAFEGLLEGTARSFRQHGFRHVVFLWDHGGYQKNVERVVAKLQREWGKDAACQVHALSAYYQATQTAYVAELKQRGHGMAEIGEHAGLADTSLSLAVDKSLVRGDLLAHAGPPAAHSGISGDPRRSTVELGQLGVKDIVETSVAAMKAFRPAR